MAERQVTGLKINEVEALVGITKKNIRFYEEQGLLAPARNAENGYRNYGEAEVAQLRQIKVLRKLGVPMEEIRKMQAGTHTLSDGMSRHLITLQREQRNLEQSIQMCRSLQEQEISLSELDTEAVLAQMESLERGGASFQNKQVQDIRVQYVAPVIITVMMVCLMTGLAMLMLWAYFLAPEEAPPVWFLIVLLCVLAAIIAGTVLALIQRIREIGKGEMNDAKRY